MFTQVKVYDLGALVFCGVVSWLAFLCYMIPLALVWYLATGQITTSEILAPLRNLHKLHWQDIVFAVIYLLISTATTYGMYYCWKNPAFFTIDPSGGWACRNSFYFPLQRIHPHQSRQVTAKLSSRFDTEINETVLSGDFRVLTESAEPITFPYSGAPLPNGKPALFQELGYPADFPLASDADGNLTTPPHTWTASGPLHHGDG